MDSAYDRRFSSRPGLVPPKSHQAAAAAKLPVGAGPGHHLPSLVAGCPCSLNVQGTLGSRTGTRPSQAGLVTGSYPGVWFQGCWFLHTPSPVAPPGPWHQGLRPSPDAPGRLLQKGCAQAAPRSARPEPEQPLPAQTPNSTPVRPRARGRGQKQDGKQGGHTWAGDLFPEAPKTQDFLNSQGSLHGHW